MPDPRGFLTFPREELPKRPVELRRRDWAPVQEAPNATFLGRQAGRCMGCGVPFCQGPTGCPLGNAVPDWNDLVRLGRYEDALRILHATNNFPELTGTLCPAPCESACVLELAGDAVNIRAIEAGIIARGFERGWIRPERAAAPTGRSVAVVGSGPAGLAAAQQLARRGHGVIVYERDALPGGLVRYGVPDFKIDKSLLERRLRQLEEEGVTFRTGVEVGVDVDPQQLRREFDAVCLTIGAGAARDLAVPGRELAGIHLAMDYLSAQTRAATGDATAPVISAKGKRVIILGGGDTGSDCLGTAHRQGAADVLQLELLPRPPASRSLETPWPQWPLVLRTSPAHEEGGRRAWQIETTDFLGENGQVVALRARKVERVGGRFVPVAGDDVVLPADLVLLALGFRGPAVDTLANGFGLALDDRGNVRTDGAFMTRLPGVFAAGDARRGASLIVWAIAEGRQMAAGVDAYLTTHPL